MTHLCAEYIIILLRLRKKELGVLSSGPMAKEGKRKMAEIHVKENESLDSALRRFKRSCARSGVLAEIRKHECYEKPSVRRKKKSEAARKRKY